MSMFKRLGALGWAEGRNLRIEFRTFDPGLLFLAAMVKELERVKCDVIVANSTPAALAVKASAPATPLVFLVGGDPVALGLV
ncbi:MAG: hypothetical protein MUF16_11845, partial [Burkholderiaceae bacterium]|nr:hypothetical protein [Burkholderiaceae bacterium]